MGGRTDQVEDKNRGVRARFESSDLGAGTFSHPMHALVFDTREGGVLDFGLVNCSAVRGYICMYVCICDIRIREMVCTL